MISIIPHSNHSFISSISANIRNSHEIQKYQSLSFLSKRYRKKLPKKFWKYMYRGHYPYRKKSDETEPEKDVRQQRILKNRRGHGRNFFDWMSMPHLQYMINSPNILPDGSSAGPRCRMMKEKWKKYPEPTFWNVYYVSDEYSAMEEKGDKDNEYYDNSSASKLMQQKMNAWGKLVWRGEEEPNIKEITKLRRRGWVWLPCDNWLRLEQTKNEDFQPVIRKKGKLAL